MHPSELLAPESRRIYELLKYETEQMLLDDSDFNERSLSIARGSREIRMWEKFFENSDRRGDDREFSEAQEQIEDALMMPEGADPLDDTDARAGAMAESEGTSTGESDTD